LLASSALAGGALRGLAVPIAVRKGEGGRDKPSHDRGGYGASLQRPELHERVVCDSCYISGVSVNYVASMFSLAVDSKHVGLPCVLHLHSASLI
jgi:hypothetical protein